MILVTGATGFLGAALVVQLLESEEKIRCTKRETSLIPKILTPHGQKIEWVDADILDFSALEDAFENIHQVYHCAATVSFEKKERDKMMAINVNGTENIVNLCLANGVEKLVHVSSVAALGNVKPGEEVTENNFWDAYDKNGNYAVSKYRGEMEVWRGMNEGLKAVIVNPSVIIGENLGENGSGKIFSAVKNGLDYYTNGSTGFVDVKDVASAMISLMNSDIEEERFILNSENYSYKNLLSEIATNFKLEPPKKQAKKWMLNMLSLTGGLWSLFTKSPVSLSGELLKSAFNTTQYSNKKIVAAIGITFIPIDLSITKTVNSFKSV
jgi:dihydroflavonol-4-reductase